MNKSGMQELAAIEPIEGVVVIDGLADYVIFTYDLSSQLSLLSWHLSTAPAIFFKEEPSMLRIIQVYYFV